MMAEKQGSTGEREFVFLMASCQMMIGLAIDMMLPALGTIAAELHAGDPNHRQLVIGIFLVGMGLGCLIPGTLSDRLGRRPVLFGCLVCYILPMAACAMVKDFETLLVLRLFQAIGSSGLSVLPAAMIRDRFEGDRMARMQSMVAMVFMLVPVLAPTIGQVVIDLAGWRWVFGALALYGLVVGTWAWFRLPETRHAEHRIPMGFGVILGNLGNVLRCRPAIGYILASGFMTGGIFGFVNSSQQLIGEHFHAGKAFPYIFGALAAGMSLASFVNSRIVMRFGSRRVSHGALIVYVIAAIGQAAAASGPNPTLLQFSCLMALSMSMSGFLNANFTSIALQPFARTAGAAASVFALMRSLISAAVGMAIGQLYDGTALPYALSLLACGVIALALVLYSEEGRLFRRLNPPPV